MENSKPKKFLFIGRTASGKSSIAKAVCEKIGLKQVKSYTTRPARPGETNENADHYFVTKEEFDLIMAEHLGCVAAYTKINDFEYCTTTDILDKSDIYVIDPDGVNTLKKNCGDKYEFIEVYFRVPFLLSCQRYQERGGNKSRAEFVARYDSEREQFDKYEKEKSFQYHVLNDGSFDESVEKVCKFIKKELENNI